MSVIVERNGPVTTLVIARPERRNAVDRPTAQALADALREFEADDTARVAVLTGSGGNFCAGADLAAVAEDGERRNRLEAEGDGPMGPSRMQLGKPLIAAIEGYAVAGGLELALLADLRVMAEDAICGVFCRRFGVPLIDGGSVRLPRIVGQGPGARPDPHRASGEGRRSVADRPGQPGGAERFGASRGRGAGGGTRRLPADLHARRPRQRIRAVGTVLRRGPGQRIPGRAGGDRERRDLEGAQRFKDGEGRHGRFE